MLDVKEIQRRVHALLEQNDIVRPPVPVEQIVENIGLEIRYGPFEGDLSGAFVRDKDETFIGVNSKDALTRQRFTIAHELAHFLYHKDINVHVDKGFQIIPRNGRSAQGIDPHEMVANRFAAELLIPTEFLARDIRRLKAVNRGTLDALAKRYKASGRAMRIRLGNFGIFLPD